MKLVTGLAIAGVGVGILYLLHRHFNLNRLKFDIYGLDGGFAGDYIDITATLLVTNSTDSDFTINGAEGQVTIAGDPIGTVQYLSESPVAAKSQSTYPILLRLPIVSAAADVVNIITGNAGQGVSSSFAFNGNIYLDGQAHALNLNYNLV
jgi:hypothetical protein